MVVNKINPFKGWSLQNFPFIEADFDALTNYEMICKITEYLNTVITNQNELNEAYNTLLNGYKELYDYVNTYLTDIDEVKEDIKRIDASLETMTTLINSNAHNISLLNERIETEISSVRDYIDGKVEDLEEEIQNIQIGNINIYDPTTGLLSPIQTVINNIAAESNKDGLTASEFDLLDLTATAFDAYQITARDFDSQGKTILV